MFIITGELPTIRQAFVLRGMVRSVLTSGEKLSVKEMVDVIVDTFLYGARSKAPEAPSP